MSNRNGEILLHFQKCKNFEMQGREGIKFPLQIFILGDVPSSYYTFPLDVSSSNAYAWLELHPIHKNRCNYAKYVAYLFWCYYDRIFYLHLLFVISFLRIKLFLIKYNDHCDKYQYLLSIILKIKNEFKNHLLIGCVPSHFRSYFPLKICEKTCQQNIQ